MKKNKATKIPEVNMADLCESINFNSLLLLQIKKSINK